MYFAASFQNLSTGNIDITADGQNITIVDNSDYVYYTGTAVTGGVGSMTLPTDASIYDDFYNGMEFEIISGTGSGTNGTITNYNGTTKVATLSTGTTDSTSVFQIGEPGHLQSYFADFRKVLIENSVMGDYLFSSIGDGDATTLPAATASLPITDTYAYTSGDGIYTITLYTLPTWDALVAYLQVRNVYVYYNGVYYQLLKDDTGTTPGTDATVWAVVSDIDDLPAKYRRQVKIAVLCDIRLCWSNFVLAADQRNKCTVCNNEIWMRNVDVQKAFKLKMILDAVDVLMYQGLYDDAQTSINLGRSLCCCS